MGTPQDPQDPPYPMPPPPFPLRDPDAPPDPDEDEPTPVPLPSVLSRDREPEPKLPEPDPDPEWDQPGVSPPGWRNCGKPACAVGLSRPMAGCLPCPKARSWGIQNRALENWFLRSYAVRPASAFHACDPPE